MRNKKIATYLCTGLLMLMAAGCVNSNEDSDVTIVDSIDFNNTNTKENSSNYQSDKDNDDSRQDSSPSQAEADNEQLASDSKLDGSIESIGDNSVVINKTFYPSENEAVSYEGSEKALVTVYFSEETEFEVWTVKNGGMNGDTAAEKRQGTFSDLKLDANINMTGSYDGNDFSAKFVIIYNFV